MTLQEGFAVLLVLAAVCFIAFAALMMLWYRRDQQQERQRLAQTKADIADMTILFQTMRDIMNQQKNLARSFNQEIEKKMGMVRQILSTSIEKNERLYEKQQSLVRQLEESRAQLESLQRQITYLNEFVQAAPPAAGAPAVQKPIRPAKPAPAPKATPAPQEPAATTPQEMPFDSWFAQDQDVPFAPDPPAEELIPESPLADEDAAAARAAFRSLLNMSAPLADALGSPGDAPAPAGPNGSPNPLLQQRVLEYSQAGMSIADIAAELGVGKGEVRLMLSLARQRKSP